MKKGKTWMKTLFAVVMLSLVLCGMSRTEAEAASKAKYSYKKVDKSRSYDSGRVKAKVYYKKAVLKGKSSAVKKINKAVTRDCNKFLKSANGLFEYAKSDSENEYLNGEKLKYYYYATSKVTYNKKGIISIKITTKWFAGGVSNVDVYGLTYSLKTGKRLYLTNVCSGSAGTIKKNVLNKIRKDPEAEMMDWKVLNSYKVKKMDFYLKPNKKAVVCFEPYEINYGGWYRSFTIKSKYK